MKSDRNLVENERGVMVFALIGVVILLLSIYAGVYFASVNTKSQQDVVDLGELRNVERELDRVERELNSAAEEAGHEAVDRAKEEFFDGYTLNDLEKKIAEESKSKFEDYFDQHHSDSKEIRGFNIELHLRPLPKDEAGIELVPLYLEETERDEGRVKIPGFFKIERTVYAHIKDPSLGTVSTKKFDIEREIKTDLFVLAERARHFDPTGIRKMTDCMMSAYLNAKVFSGATEKEIGFKKDFSEIFSTDRLERYARHFENGGDSDPRGEPWQKNSTGFIEGFKRDIGKLGPEDLVSKKDLIGTIELAVLIEQIRVFRSHDGSLLASVSDHFDVEGKDILDMIGEGDGNRLNLQRLIVTLFQKKGKLPEKVFYPDLFLKGMMEEDLPGIIEDSEEWTDISFGMINELVKGETEEEDRWDYMEFDENIASIEELDEDRSYLRVLFSLYSNSMEDILKSFKVDSEEVESFVFDKIKDLGPIPWMEDIEIIGENGTNEMVKSILYRGENLSMSFGFEEGSYETTAFPFYYMYYFNDWGFSNAELKGEMPLEQIDTQGIKRGARDKIASEMRSRSENLEDTANSSYDRVTDRIASYNETDWYNAGDETQGEVWDRLNNTLEPFSSLSEVRLFEFDGSDPPHVSEELEENYEELDKKIGEVKKIGDDLSEDASEYTEKILEMERNYTGNKWRYEAYDHLYSGGDFDFFNRSDYLLTASAEELSSYNWSLKSFSLEDHIEPAQKTDQSIGQRALGNFTDEMIRAWESPTPMDYTNPRGLFKLVNQNLFHLTNHSEKSDENRLRSILRGSGDPASDHLTEDTLPNSSVKLIDGPVSSEVSSEIDDWVVTDSLDRTIDDLKKTTEVLEKRSKELTREEVGDRVYTSYAHASFYRTALRVLDPMVDTIKEYRKTIRSLETSTGYPTLGDENQDLRNPVISMPRGDLVVHRASDSRAADKSYSLDLDVNMSYSDDLAEVDELDSTATRVYTDGADKGYEWINPFSRGSGDQYRTIFTMDYSTSAFDLDLRTKETAPLVSYRYSSSAFTVGVDEKKHKGLIETASPVPLLETEYAPRSASSPGIEMVSIDKNVFNGSKERVGVNLVINDEEKIEGEELLVEVVKRDDLSYISPNQRDRLMNIDHLYDEGIEEDKDQKVIGREWVTSENLEGDKIGLEIDLDKMDLPQEETYRGHLSVRVRSEFEVSYMKGVRDLDQSSSDEDHHSPVPAVSNSEPAYIFEDRRSYLGVFRVEDGSCQRYDYDLVCDIPEDSWIIRKNGLDYMVDFEGSMEMRNILSGSFGDEIEDQSAEKIPVDPVAEVDGVMRYQTSLPDNAYGSLLKTDLLPVYTRATGDKDCTIPEEMVPVPEDGNSWGRLQKTVVETRDVLDVSTEDEFKLYHKIGEYHSERRVGHSFQRTKNAVNDPSLSRSFHFSLDSDGIKMLRDAGLIDDFSGASYSKRRDLFLASCYAGEEMDTVRKLAGDEFDLGPVAKSLDMIGKNSTGEILDWLCEEREKARSSELRAFLSFDKELVKELPSKMAEYNYSEALDSLDAEMGDRTFVEARRWNIADIDDTKSLDNLTELYDEKTLLEVLGFGVRPFAVENLTTEKSIELKVLVDSMSQFSNSSKFQSLIEQLNSRIYDQVPSIYVAGSAEASSVNWKPYGDGSPYLILDGKIVHAEIASIDSISELEDFVDRALKEAVEKNPPERARVIIEVQDFSPDEEQREEIRGFVGNKTSEYDPVYTNVSSANLNFADGTAVNYFHL